MIAEVSQAFRGRRSSPGPVQPSGTDPWKGYLFDHNYFMTPHGLLVCDPLFVSGFIQATGGCDTRGRPIVRLFYGNEIYLGVMPVADQFQVISVTAAPPPPH